MFHIPAQYSNKPWFDRDCRSASNLVRLSFRIFYSCPTNDNRVTAVNSRKEYVRIVKLKKRLYYEEIQEKLADCDSRSAFWRTVNMFRNKRGASCDISKDIWETFYDNELATPDNDDIRDVFPECT